jgi:aspartate/tyrosine/aromatic aminotransferase
LYTDITKVSQMAKQHKKNNPFVIDTTSGVFIDESFAIGYSKTFDNLADTLVPLLKYNYGGVSGGAKFQKNFIRWLFGDEELSVPLTPFATMGATGALSNTLDIYGKPGKSILTTDLFWHNYELMANTHQMHLVTFPFTVEGTFNQQGFKETIDKIVAREDSLIFILNQPAHNPTGYSLSKTEMQNLLEILGSIQKEVILLYDIAYLDLAKEKSHFDLLFNTKENIKVIMAYSFSKSLGLYGLRLGASALVGGTPQEREYFNEQNYLLSRTKWNSPNQVAVNTFNLIMESEENIKSVKSEISGVKETLKQRSAYLINFLNENNIPYYPYSDGFFVTIKTSNPVALFEQFRNHLIYPIVVNKGIRIAIAPLPMQVLEDLCQRMKVIDFSV